jgi:uncharacterized protein
MSPRTPSPTDHVRPAHKNAPSLLPHATLQIAHDLRLPADAVTETFAILAKRGAGKTYTAAVMVEELLQAGLQVVVADPVGVWWGLRASANGQQEGLPIMIIGGEHGDVPLEVGAGEIIADVVVDEGLSVVLDLSHLRKGEQTRFMMEFAERLYHKNRQPLHLVLDEADAFAPQRPMKGQERLLGAIEDLVRRGRARGTGVTPVTQRAAVLNKDVLTQAEVLVALRTIAPQDREAIDAWIRVHGTPAEREQLMASLPSLPVGTAWVWSPGWLDVFQQVQIRRKATFDSSATPKVGAVRLEPKTLAAVDLERLRARLAMVIERANADDPRALRRRMAERERGQKPQIVVERVEVPVLQPGQIEHLQALVTDLGALTEALSRALARAQGQGAAHAHPAHPAQPTSTPAPPRTSSQKTERPLLRDLAELELRAGERRMLQTLAQRHPTILTRAQLGTLAGFTPSGGTFGAYFGTLKRHGLLTEAAGGDVAITAKGLRYLGRDVPPTPQTTAEFLAMWQRALRRGEWRMLEVLVQAYPKALTREALGEHTGYTASGGTFGTYLGTLRRNGLIEVDSAHVRASQTLFVGA